MATKENQQPSSLRNIVHGWNEPSLLLQKSNSGLNLRQQKDSPFTEVNFQRSSFFSEYSSIIINRIVILLLKKPRLY